MGRLFRIFFNVLTVVLAVLTLAALIAWPVSYVWGAPCVSHRWVAPVPNSGIPGSLGGTHETYDKVAITQGVMVISRSVSCPPLAETGLPGFPAEYGWRVRHDLIEDRILRVMPANRWRVDYEDPWLDPEYPHFGYGWSPFTRLVQRPPEQTGVRLTIPLWWLAIGLGALPGFRLHGFIRRAVRTRQRRRAGLCTKCGYDLRATPTRCPECGTAA